MLAFALFLHVTAACIWVGGMAFAVFALRPAAGLLPVEYRSAVWEAALSRFFAVVLVSVVLILLTGFHMLGKLYGGFAGAPLHVSLMFGLGLLMMLIFGHALFAPFRRLRAAISAGLPELAQQQLTQLRWLVTGNLILGIITIGVATGGRLGALH